jgi:hypothetical protein
MIPLLGVAAFIIAATTSAVDGPAPMSESVARVQFAKLGYTRIVILKRNGDYWEATVTKNGAPQLIRLSALGLGSRPLHRIPHPMIVKPPT